MAISNDNWDKMYQIKYNILRPQLNNGEKDGNHFLYGSLIMDLTKQTEKSRRAG
jgi:hypothetical protein